jgi:RNA polymerase sigma-32 factor
MHYLLDPDRSRPLSAEELHQLTVAYRRSRDPGLERRLVEANMRLVLKIARAYDRTQGDRLPDLVQEGMLGLIEAIRRFDPTRGATLGTYASYWIRAFIGKYAMENARVVRAVRTRADRAAFHRGEIKWSEVSLDAAAGHDDRPLRERLADPRPGADELIAAAELTHRAEAEVGRLKQVLPARDVIILKERMLSERPKSCREVGDRLAISGERVRQIEAVLRATLRRRLSVDRVAAAA